MTNEKQNKYFAPAVSQAIGIINYLSETDNGAPLAEISKQLGLNKNTAQRILMTMTQEGWLSLHQPGPTYRLTLEPFRVSSKELRRCNVYEKSLDPLRELWRDINELVYMAIPYQNQVMHTIVLETERDVNISLKVGATYPMTAGATGRIFYAYGSTEQQKCAVKGIQTTEKKKYLTYCSDALAQGYSIHHADNGLSCFSAPIFDHTGQCVAGTGISVFSSFCPEKKLLELGHKLIEVNQAISMELGYKYNNRDHS